MYKKVLGIFGVPRSGTSWLGEIFNSSPDVKYKLQPFFAYALKDRLNPNSNPKEIECFFQTLYSIEDDFMDQSENRKEGKYPVFEKKLLSPSNLVFKETRYLYMAPVLLNKNSTVKMVFIYRNPIDVINSWLNAPKEFKKDWDIRKEWLFAIRKNEFRPENYFGYHKWKEAISIFCELKEMFGDRVFVINYDNLRVNTEEVVSHIFQFAEIEMSSQTTEFISISKNQQIDDAYSVFRNIKAEKCQELHLPEDIILEINNDLSNFALIRNIL